MVDGQIDVAIRRTGEGIIIDLYAKDCIDPFDSLAIGDDEIAEALADAETDEAEEA